MNRTEAIRTGLTAVLVKKRELERERRDPNYEPLTDQLDQDINRYDEAAKVLNKMLKRRTAA